MVSSFGGNACPGTPDGMFEEHNGDLTCVQVVRVPITSDMTSKEQEDLIYNTVLDKLVKSQQWMKFTRIVPHEFVIFCWCQGWPDTAGNRTQALIERVRDEGWPFMLKLMVPTEPGALFPVKFAYQRAGQEGGELSKRKFRPRKYSELDLSTYVPEDFVSDDEAPEWYLFDDEEEVSSLESELDINEYPTEGPKKVQCELDFPRVCGHLHNPTEDVDKVPDESPEKTRDIVPSRAGMSSF